MCRSVLSLSKIAHQIWRDHSFCQRNRTTERTVGVGLEKTGKWMGLDKISKKGEGNIGGVFIKWGFSTPQ